MLEHNNNLDNNSNNNNINNSNININTNNNITSSNIQNVNSNNKSTPISTLDSINQQYQSNLNPNMIHVQGGKNSIPNNGIVIPGVSPLMYPFFILNGQPGTIPVPLPNMMYSQPGVSPNPPSSSMATVAPIVTNTLSNHSINDGSTKNSNQSSIPGFDPSTNQFNYQLYLNFAKNFILQNGIPQNMIDKQQIMSQPIEQNVQQSLPQNIQYTNSQIPQPTQNLQQNKSQNMQQNTQQNIQQNIPQNIPNSIQQTQNLPQNMRQSIPLNIQQNIQQSTAQTMNQQNLQVLTQNIQQCIPQNISQNIQQNIPPQNIQQSNINLQGQTPTYLPQGPIQNHINLAIVQNHPQPFLLKNQFPQYLNTQSQSFPTQINSNSIISSPNQINMSPNILFPPGQSYIQPQLPQNPYQFHQFKQNPINSSNDNEENNSQELKKTRISEEITKSSTLDNPTNQTPVSPNVTTPISSESKIIPSESKISSLNTTETHTKKVSVPLPPLLSDDYTPLDISTLKNSLSTIQLSKIKQIIFPLEILIPLINNHYKIMNEAKLKNGKQDENKSQTDVEESQTNSSVIDNTSSPSSSSSLSLSTTTSSCPPSPSKESNANLKYQLMLIRSILSLHQDHWNKLNKILKKSNESIKSTSTKCKRNILLCFSSILINDKKFFHDLFFNNNYKNDEALFTYNKLLSTTSAFYKSTSDSDFLILSSPPSPNIPTSTTISSASSDNNNTISKEILNSPPLSTVSTSSVSSKSTTIASTSVQTPSLISPSISSKNLSFGVEYFKINSAFSDYIDQFANSLANTDFNSTNNLYICEHSVLKSEEINYWLNSVMNS